MRRSDPVVSWYWRKAASPVIASIRRTPAEMLTSGYLERLGFHYKPATPATMYRHPSKLGMRA